MTALRFTSSDPSRGADARGEVGVAKTVAQARKMGVSDDARRSFTRAGVGRGHVDGDDLGVRRVRGR